MKLTRHRLIAAGAAAAVLATAVFVAGATAARLSATTPSRTSSLAAGTVSLTSTAVSTCTITNLLPGGSAGPCQLRASYGGSVPAYLGVDVLIATKPQSPGTTPLYNPSDSSNDLQVTVSDSQSPSITYVTPASNFGTALASCPAASGFDSSYTCYRITDVLVSTTPYASSSTPDTFSTSATLPSGNPTAYQGGTASIVLTVHAVQAGNQTLGTCVAGSTCTSVSWN